MTALYRRIEAALRGPIPVLLVGETGVGKEMIARILHLSSPRSEAPFLAVNCSAIPADLLEAELFGIEKAVATGVDPRPGLFLSAAGGTLLLDEIGDMRPALQAKLLRVLQDKEVRPLGGTTSRRIEVRIVSATNADLRQLIDAGRFREDLYFRLAGDVLEVPPLRRCQDDIQPLAKHFLEKFSREIDVRPRGLSLKAARLLRSYSWPGNVRELENEIRRLVYHASEGQIIDSSLLSARIRSPVDASGTGGVAGAGAGIEPGALALAVRVREFEAEVISEALRRCGGNQTRAAEVLEMSRNGLLKKMKRLGIAG
jgi:transcriptional regulator with PAS, ATPase and Fis domain